MQQIAMEQYVWYKAGDVEHTFCKGVGHSMLD